MARLKLEYPDQAYTHSTTLQVRFDDINAGMHLAHDRLVSFVAEARSRFLEHLGISEIGDERTPGVIVSDLAVVYRAEARLRDTLRLDSGIVDLTRYGGDVICRVIRESDGTLVGVAKVNLVFFDYHGSNRPAPAPAAFTDAAN
ncbi:acyl-CoA thioesterase FadM [Kineosphaera limosa]|nr:thioesterase family protein [Kineosphaera limosa]NYD98940.1 acyl-CoA thioesterase FadM [Kineosphaera limosa]